MDPNRISWVHLLTAGVLQAHYILFGPKNPCIRLYELQGSNWRRTLKDRTWSLFWLISVVCLFVFNPQQKTKHVFLWFFFSKKLCPPSTSQQWKYPSKTIHAGPPGPPLSHLLFQEFLPSTSTKKNAAEKSVTFSESFRWLQLRCTKISDRKSVNGLYLTYSWIHPPWN